MAGGLKSDSVIRSLLERLASDAVASDVMPVAWEPRPPSPEWFEKQRGKRVSQKHDNKRVGDLRKLLAQAGIVRPLVLTHRRWGVWFALRRPSRLSPRVVSSVAGDRL